MLDNALFIVACQVGSNSLSLALSAVERRTAALFYTRDRRFAVRAGKVFAVINQPRVAVAAVISAFEIFRVGRLAVTVTDGFG